MVHHNPQIDIIIFRYHLILIDFDAPNSWASDYNDYRLYVVIWKTVAVSGAQ